MEYITCCVADLGSEDRSAFERVVGHPLSEDQQLKIEVVGKRNRQPRPRPPVTGVPTLGLYEGRLVVPDNFEEPLDDLREYVE